MRLKSLDKTKVFIRVIRMSVLREGSVKVNKSVLKKSGRMLSVYTEMKSNCQVEITAYGSCLAEHIQDVRKGCCGEQYAQLHDCFLQARSNLRSSK